MRQSDLRFTFSVSSSQTDFEVVQFRLEEALSEPFRLTVELASCQSGIDFEKVLDQPALLTLWDGATPARHVHGLVSSFTQGATGFRRTRYQAVVEPHLARLALCSNWRIFQEKTVPEILKSLLQEHGLLDYQPNFQTEHLIREYCVQAGDNDLYLFDRLSAEEGLFYYFTLQEQRRGQALHRKPAARVSPRRAGRLDSGRRSPPAPRPVLPAGRTSPG